jgi:mannose-6-phosphate isomerase
MFARITNSPRNYSWGSTHAIADLLGRVPSGQPEAELWLGDHAANSSVLTDTNEALSEVTGGRLPFLLKVLAAQSPLSLQVHPTIAQAIAGFERENGEGIALDAPERNYKDESAKPELIFALSDEFRLLCGFRPVAAVQSIIAELRSVAPDARSLEDWASRLQAGADIRPCVSWLVTDGDGVDTLIDDVVIAASGLEGEHFHLVGELAAAYPGDPGIVLSLMINLMTLKRGEVLFVDAGTIHSYLSGLGVELMAPSDNVLRGGLTPKHLDAAELLSILDVNPSRVERLRPTASDSASSVFAPMGSGISLTHITSRTEVELSSDAIVLCTRGTFSLEGAHGRTVLSRGDSAFVSKDEGAITCDGDGELFLAMGA